MSKFLLRTQLAFDNCYGHLDDCNAWGTEVESYLTQHVLVILCAEVQQEIYLLVEDRASLAGDEGLKNYAVATCKKVLRSIAKGEIAGFVGLFGSPAKDYLNENIREEDVALYNNAIAGRHDVAHKTGTNITFRELSSILTAARNLLLVVSVALEK